MSHILTYCHRKKHSLDQPKIFTRCQVLTFFVNPTSVAGLIKAKCQRKIQKADSALMVYTWPSRWWSLRTIPPPPTTCFQHHLQGGLDTPSSVTVMANRRPRRLNKLTFKNCEYYLKTLWMTCDDCSRYRKFLNRTFSVLYMINLPGPRVALTSHKNENALEIYILEENKPGKTQKTFDVVADATWASNKLKIDPGCFLVTIF